MVKRVQLWQKILKNKRNNKFNYNLVRYLELEIISQMKIKINNADKNYSV